MKKTPLIRQKSKTSISTLKRKLWKVFSLFIRQRDNYRCFTCGRHATGSGMHAGHYIPKSAGGIILYFNEKNVHAQCLTRESNIKMQNGIYKAIGKIKTGDNLKAFNENTLKPEVSVVESVKSFIPEKLYEIELEDGSIFKATPDHRVVANGKWNSIQQILRDSTTYDILEI